MNTGCKILSLSMMTLAGCAANPPATPAPAAADPETVLVTHVKSGRVAELRTLLGRAWVIYSEEHLIRAEPHLLAQAADDPDTNRLIEIFTWVSHSAPDHAPASVTAIWEQEQSLCEPRSGHPAIEIGEVELMIPSSKEIK